MYAFFHSALFSFFYNPDAYFVKEPDGERDDDEREGVGGGRDDGGDDEDGNNRVASVLRHPDGFHQVELGEQPGEDGNFEYDAKGKRHQEEGVDVGTDGQHVVYVGTDLVEPKEVDGEGEEEEVVEQDANEEREVGAEGDLTRVAPLIFVEGRGDEPEKDVQDVGRGCQKTDAHGRLEVNHHLLCKSGVDEVKVKGIDSQPSVRHEVAMAGRKDDVEHRLLEAECCNARHKYNHKDAYQASAQFLQVIPKVLFFAHFDFIFCLFFLVQGATVSLFLLLLLFVGVDALHSVLEALNTTAHSVHQLGYLLASKKEKNNHYNKDDFCSSNHNVLLF